MIIRILKEKSTVTLYWFGGSEMTLLRGLTVFFLCITFMVGIISWSDSTRRVDKLRFSFLTIGSMLSLIFSINC